MSHAEPSIAEWQSHKSITVIDLVASGLHKESYPIEVGWSVDDEQAPEAALIRPAADWTKTDFSDAAHTIHAIAYEALLEQGIP